MSVLRRLLSNLLLWQRTTVSGGKSTYYHSLINPTVFTRIGGPSLLSPGTVCVTQTCGFKVKGKVRRRCKDCYFVMRQERLYVICKTHPRHKQMSMVKDERNTWTLTHATQGKIRPW